MPDLIYHAESDCLFWGTFDDAAAMAGANAVQLDNLRRGVQVDVGLSRATALADMDFETFSEAGYVWTPAKPPERVFNPKTGQWKLKTYQPKWAAPKGATKKGIFAVGAAAYASHPSTEVVSLYYDLKDGKGRRFWRPGWPLPTDLFLHVQQGGQVVEAHNASFEYWIWSKVCATKYGWPAPRPEWFADSMAKAQAWSLPGKLDEIGKVLELKTQKQGDGKRLIQKFSVPRNPTKNKPATRTYVEDEPEDGAAFFGYNEGDIITEFEASLRIPDLPPAEHAFWLDTFRMNIRGVGIDLDAVANCSAVLDQTLELYNARLCELTGGQVEKASQTQRLKEWLAGLGVYMESLDSEHIETALTRTDLPPIARKAMDYRARAGSASVKKLYAMERMQVAGRLHDLFVYHRARTGRDGGADVQPQNLPKAGPEIAPCSGCGKDHGAHAPICSFCGSPLRLDKAEEWNWRAVPQALEVLAGRSVELVERVYGDALLVISGCVRGLFVSGPAKDLVCSDYSSIEAVVTAVLAGEQWRIEAFQRKEDIYYHGAAGITGLTYAQYKEHEAQNGKHPDRQKIGKPAELGLGFGGWIPAWRQFDKSDNFTDDEVKRNIIAWREASPMIVEMWGGQVRGKPWNPDRKELYGLEGMAIAATMNPGHAYRYRAITYRVKDDVLYCQLPSGRFLAYHRPRLSPSQKWEGQLSLSFEGWNSNPKMGPIGWIRIHTFGGRLFENVVQAVARDIMRDAVRRLESAGYPIVLRVHDELAAEVPEGAGSIEEFERIMAELPPWAEGWPIRAAGGWRGKRYRKD